MRGGDGILIASDRREISNYQTAKVSNKNDVVKIRLSPDAKFAWAYSGNMIAPIYSRQIVRAFQNPDAEGLSDVDAKQILNDCGPSAIREYTDQQKSGSLGPYDAPTIVMACGESKKIFRSVAMPTTEAEEIKKGLCTTGQTGNWAAFLPERFYSSRMSIDELLWIAVVSVRMAHDFDNLAVDRLDVALYRDSDHKFTLVDGDFHWEEIGAFARKIDASILRMIKKQSRIQWQ
jgi:20S proteasome alpha/beta subunit